MRRFPLFLLLLAACTMSAASFPRKHLLEHFTGEACGYCPNGMNAIQSTLAAHPNKQFVWVSHHYGYGSDEYSIPLNTKIGVMLKVSGAPYVCLNRVKHNYGQASALIYTPDHLPSMSIPDADTALVSVVIDRTYDAASRLLSVSVHGQSVDPVRRQYKLNVLLIENNLIGAQQDYYYTWEGWSKYRHNHVARANLSLELGDKLTLDEQGNYSVDYSYTLPAAWKDSCCCVVAYLTSSALGEVNMNVFNAELVPVVAGTDGGESHVCEGLEAVPVATTYPEFGSPAAAISMNHLQVTPNSGYQVVTLTSESTFLYDGYLCTPRLTLYVWGSSVAPGTYSIDSSMSLGSVCYGFRDDTNFSLVGSSLRYTYTYQGNTYTMGTWLLRSGSVVVGGDGSYLVTATTLNGSTFTATYRLSSPVTELSAPSQTSVRLVDGRIRIRRGEADYDLQGRRL